MIEINMSVFPFLQNAAEKACKERCGKVGKEGDDDGARPSPARKIQGGKIKHRLARGVHGAGAAADVRVGAVLGAQLPYQREGAAARKGLDEHERDDGRRHAEGGESGFQRFGKCGGKPACLKQTCQHEYGSDVRKQLFDERECTARALGKAVVDAHLAKGRRDEHDDEENGKEDIHRRQKRRTSRTPRRSEAREESRAGSRTEKGSAEPACTRSERAVEGSSCSPAQLTTKNISCE